METRTQQALARLRHFGAQLNPDLPPVDAALPALRALLDGLDVEYRIVGGAAVIHHGYERLTVDLGVLIAPEDAETLDPHLGPGGFVRESARRLRHASTRTRVDLLCAGDTLPGRRAATLPSPGEVGRSDEDPAFIALSDLLDLKLDAGRHQDLADVVALLKRLDEGGYIAVEAGVRGEHRATLAALRDDALEELAWARALDPEAPGDERA